MYKDYIVPGSLVWWKFVDLNDKSPTDLVNCWLSLPKLSPRNFWVILLKGGSWSQTHNMLMWINNKPTATLVGLCSWGSWWRHNIRGAYAPLHSHRPYWRCVWKGSPLYRGFGIISRTFLKTETFVQGVKYSIEVSSLDMAWKRHVATWRTNAELNNLFATLDGQRLPYFFDFCCCFVVFFVFVLF